ncbi:MAG: Fic family protein [Planctomycetes bacterium]|nr:Fic family protein [Planctomycetota bacterium]
MSRSTGSYRVSVLADETVRAFVPAPLPPAEPPLRLEGQLETACTRAMTAIARLEVAANLVPSMQWFLYGFVRKEAVLTSQIEGTEATLQDVLEFEATQRTDRADDVAEVCNYVEALDYARREIAKSKGLPLSTRLLCQAHRRLMKGSGGRRGGDKKPGVIRTSQNWVGGTRPGNARFVPPPADAVPAALAQLDRWIHGRDPLPPLVKAGLAHVQFETIHPFLDGNGRIGRLLITLLLEHWGVMRSPILYLSHSFKRHQREYYDRLSAVRTDGDWEGWTRFYLSCVEQAAEDGVSVAQRIHALTSKDRGRLMSHRSATVAAIQLLDLLPSNPMVTVPKATRLLGGTAPTARKAVELLEGIGVLRETSGRKRDRVYAYHAYLQALTTEDGRA